MSSKKRSHNFNDEENKENDNRNPFCPKKPITTTLVEQRQAQNLQTQQNRAAGRAKRRSETITPSLINTAKIWNQNLPVGVADGRPENQGGHNVFKTRVLETTAPLVPLHPQDVAMNLVELHHQMSMSFYSDFILILFIFYPDFIQILSRFYSDFLEIHFIQILS